MSTGDSCAGTQSLRSFTGFFPLMASSSAAARRCRVGEVAACARGRKNRRRRVDREEMRWKACLFGTGKGVCNLGLRLHSGVTHSVLTLYSPVLRYIYIFLKKCTFVLELDRTGQSTCDGPSCVHLLRGFF